MLVALGFPYHFVQIVVTCLTSTTFPLIVNGSPLKFLKAKRGLRQGDPMSPLLFVLGMKYLSRILKCTSQDEYFNFHPRCKSIKLTHLCFADDSMLFAKGDLTSIHLMFKGLDSFVDASSLHANFSKSAIYLAGLSKEHNLTFFDRLICLLEGFL